MKSTYAGTLGDTKRRSLMIGTLYELLENKKDASEGQKRAWRNDLTSLGEGDHTNGLDDEVPYGYEFISNEN